MAVIQGIYAQEILDSRGIPTIECTLWLDTGAVVTTSVPAGTSVGKYEAHEARDANPDYMMGKGVLTAIETINRDISPLLVGKDPSNQKEIDDVIISLDGSKDMSKLGANTTLAVSQAVLKAGAAAYGVPLYSYIHQKYQLVSELSIPTCIYTMVNGGDHGADNLDIQEFQVVPARYIEFEQSLNMACTIFQKLGEVLKIKGAIHSTGLVGGYTPNLYSNSDVFEILIETIKTTPFIFSQDVFFGIDAAASEFYQSGKYILKDKSQPYSASELTEYYRRLRSVYNVFMMEDPFQDDDVSSWKTLTEELGETTTIIADSFLATNKEKTQQAIADKSCNAIMIKPNQIGTISQTLEVIQLAQSANWQVIISHRSGDTNDDILADFAVGVGAQYTKFGPPNRGERVAKYNRLRTIARDIAAASQPST